MTPPSPLILAIGDSLIAGYGLEPRDSFPAQLERQLRTVHPEASVIDAGRSGDTSGDVLARLPRVLAALDHRPDLAIVQVGPNDVLRQVPPLKSRVQLESILVDLDRCGIPVLLTTVAPPPILFDRARAYLDIHAELAAIHRATLASFFPPDVLGHPEMVLADRIHPNARAIAAVVDAIAPLVIGLVDRGGVRAASKCRAAVVR